MQQDFNISAPNEDGYDSGRPVITDPARLFMQEIKYLFDTDKGDVMGNYEFGTVARREIWKTRKSESSIKQILVSEIERFCGMSQLFNWELDIKFSQGSSRDIALIEITIEAPSNDIDGGNESLMFRYVFR